MTPERQSIIERIMALRARAANAASSEAEAEAAARIAAKIIAEHEVTEDELVAQGTSGIKEGAHNAGRTKEHPTLRVCGFAIGQLTECRALVSGGAQIWVGQPEDVAFALYLCEVIQGAAERAWARYRAGRRVRRNLRDDFLLGFGCGIQKRLEVMTEERRAARRAQETGTALVVVKAAIISDYVAETYGEIKPKRRANFRRELNLMAISSGATAAQDVNLGRPLDAPEGDGCALPEAAAE